MADSDIREILSSHKKVAVIGISANPARPSHWIARYLKDQGYDVIGVNPGLAGSRAIEGIEVVARVGDLPAGLEIVDVFRSGEHVPELVEELLPLKPRVLWLQEGAENALAEARASTAGVQVISGRCIYRDHQRLFS